MGPGHFGTVLQPLRYFEGALAVPADSQVQGLQTQVQVEGVLGALGAAEVPHQMGHGLGDVGRLAKLLGIGKAVVGGVGGGEAGEFVGILVPGEVAAVHQGTAHGDAVAVDVLGGGVGDDIGPPFKRTAQHGGGEGVVHHQRQAVFVRHLGPALDVEDLYAGVGDGLPEDQLGVGLDGGLNFLVAGVGTQEGDADAQFGKAHAQQVEGAAVDVVGGDDMVPGAGDVEHREEIGGLARRREDGTHAALQVVDLGRHGVYRGVLQTGVEVAALFQVEELAHLVRRFIFKGSALNDG